MLLKEKGRSMTNEELSVRLKELMTIEDIETFLFGIRDLYVDYDGPKGHSINDVLVHVPEGEAVLARLKSPECKEYALARVAEYKYTNNP